MAPYDCHPLARNAARARCLSVPGRRAHPSRVQGFRKPILIEPSQKRPQPASWDHRQRMLDRIRCICPSHVFA